MPISPQKIAEKVAELEKQAAWLADDVFVFMPQQYVDNHDPDDDLSAAWNEAISNAQEAAKAIERLKELLEKKADGTSPEAKA